MTNGGPTEPNPLPPILGEPESSLTLRQRARGSAEEFQKAAMAISTGSLGVFFLALTQKVDPALSGDQKVLLLVALVCMSVASLSSIFSWFADARWHAFRASAIEATNPDTRARMIVRRSFWQFVESATGVLYLVSFVPGLLCAAIYMWFRIS